MNNIRQLFLKNLNLVMGRRNLNQSQLAEKMGLKQPSMVPLMKGTSAPTIDKLADIAKSLGVDPYELLLPEVPKETPTISTLSKLIESQSKKLDGNEELLDLWNKLDEDHKAVLMKQLRNLTNKESKRKSKA